MRLCHVNLSRTLLLLLMIGFAASTLHVSTHLLTDQQNCEFCSGHLDPGHAIAASQSTPDFAVDRRPVAEPEADPTVDEAPLPYRQRAPPVLA